MQGYALCIPLCAHTQLGMQRYAWYASLSLSLYLSIYLCLSSPLLSSLSLSLSLTHSLPHTFSLTLAPLSLSRMQVNIDHELPGT